MNTKAKRIPETVFLWLPQGVRPKHSFLHLNIHCLLYTATDLKKPEKETIFENCVADVNIPVGEVFTSPRLAGTNGVLHVSEVYLNELRYENLDLSLIHI